jgi:hypothetical protein
MPDAFRVGFGWDLLLMMAVFCCDGGGGGNGDGDGGAVMKVAAATRHGDGRRMKTADGNENGEWLMRRVDEELLMRRRDTVSCYLFLWLFTGFLYYGMSTLRDCSRYVCTKGM